MPIDSGRFPREHAKYTVVLENTAGSAGTKLAQNFREK